MNEKGLFESKPDQKMTVFGNKSLFCGLPAAKRTKVSALIMNVKSAVIATQSLTMKNQKFLLLIHKF